MSLRHDMVYFLFVCFLFLAVISIDIETNAYHQVMLTISDSLDST